MSERPAGLVEDLNRILFDCITDQAIFQLDVQGRVTTWNSGAESLLGYPEGEVLGGSASRFFTPEDIEADEPTKELQQATDSDRFGEGRWLVRKDASRLWVRGITIALRDEAGGLTGFARVLQDRTEQKRAEDALAASERRYRALMENAWDGVTLVAADGTMLETTPITFRGLGYTHEEYVGRNGFELLHPEDAPTAQELLGQVLAQPGEKVVAQYRLMHKDGSWRWVEAVGTNLLDDPSVRAIVVNHRDITEQKDADRRKDQWLAMLAHELRGPLSPLSNAVQVLIHMGSNDPELVRRQDVIVRQTQHLAGIVDGLLDVSRLLRGEIRLNQKRLDLARLVRATAEDNRLALERAGLTLALEVPETPAWVMGDATRLGQILGNLLDNAIKFKGSGGQVELLLRTDSDHDQAVLIVRDAGVGIDAQMLPVLFEVFAQADRSLHRTRGGLGLGLSLVKGLVKLHGGEIRAASAGPGRGAEFIVILPLERELAALTEIPSETQQGVRQLRILVVEDNRDAADSLQLLLTLLGHEVRVAYTGPDGVRAAAAWPPEVIISDIGLPGLDGYGVASALRRNPATVGARMIAVTGYGGEEERRRALESGFDFHLTKPADPVTLQQLLAELGA